MRRWWLLLVLLLLGGTAQGASTTHRAGLVIRYGDGRVETYCVTFEEPAITGIEVLQRAGVTTIVDPSSSFGQAVCKIDGEGCDYPLEDCFCQCQNLGENCVYWAYYHLVDGQWEYSGEGAGTYEVHDGDVEGWAWGPGTAGSGTEPPMIAFDRICPVEATPSPTPTASPTSTTTPSPTPMTTPTPSFTPTESPTPCAGPGCSQLPTPTPTRARLLYTFTARRVRLSAGECTTLFWDTQGASELLLRTPGGDIPVEPQGERNVCPLQTTNYLLIMRQGDQELKASLTITVLPAASPTPMSISTQSPATDTLTPTATRMLAITSTPTERVVTRVVTPLPTSYPIPDTPTSTLTAGPSTPSPIPPRPQVIPTATLPPNARIVTPPRPLPYKLRRRTPTPVPTASPTRTSTHRTSGWSRGWRAYGLTLILLLLIVLWTYRRRPR